MANRKEWYRQGLRREEYTISGIIQGNGAAPPVLLTGAKRGIFQLTRTGVGLYGFTLEDQWQGGLLAFNFNYGDTNYGTVATRKRMTMITYDVVIAKTISVVVEDEGPDTVSELTATQFFSFEFVVRNTKDP